MSVETKQVFSGHYLVEKLIGTGAMGNVYLAHDERLHRPVAIKVLKSDELDNTSLDLYKKRFMQEARTIARLNHPNIVGVYDIGEQGRDFYMVMEYINGQNLQEILERSSNYFALNHVIQIGMQTCQALSFAHRQQIIHRDVKPANIMVSREHEVKLTDFGIARLGQSNDLRLTQAGTMLGSFMYAPPEQLMNAAEVDHRGDLYSLAATMFELATRHTVYEANNLAQLIQMVFTQNPKDCRVYRPDLPEELALFFNKALAKRPEDRFQTADEMFAALQVFSPSSVTPSSSMTPNVDVIQSPNKDTRKSNLRFNLLKTTSQSGLTSLLKHVQGSQDWIYRFLQNLNQVASEQSFAEAKSKIKQADLQGNLFSGILELQDTWVFVNKGQICGALNTSEALFNDAALERISPNSPLIHTYATEDEVALSLANLIAGSGQPVQENLDSTLVNLYPIIEDLFSEIEHFHGYVICSKFVEQSQNPQLSQVMLALIQNSQQVFSVTLDNQNQIIDTHSDLQAFVADQHCLLSIFMPRQELLHTVVKDILSMVRLRPEYHNEFDGKLDDVLTLSAGEMNHCLSEAITSNLHFQIEYEDSTLPDSFSDMLQQRKEYQCAHWLMTELFFSINANQQTKSMPSLYQNLPKISYFKCNPVLAGEHGCETQFSMIAYSENHEPLILARIGDASPIDVELFYEDAVSVKKALLHEKKNNLIAACYFSENICSSQTLLVYQKNLQKEGLLNRLKSWYKISGKDGLHFVLAEAQDEQIPRLIAPQLM